MKYTLDFFLFLVVGVVQGCTSPPRILLEYPDGRRIEVVGQAGQAEPATIVANDMEITTGGVDQALAHLSGSTSWLGTILVIAGLGLLIGSRWLPVIPRTTSIMVIAAGGAMFAFPVLLDRYSIYIFIALAGLAGLFIFGAWDNKRKLNGHTKD
jgi:hypothetical protein